jgi:hypothetical protein
LGAVKTRRTKKLEHRRDAAGVDDTKKTGPTRKLEPHREAARTASHDSADDHTDDGNEEDEGEIEHCHDDSGNSNDDEDDGDAEDSSEYEDEDDLEQDSSERGVTTVTMNTWRQRCKRPSSPGTQERHRRAQRKSKLPDGYRRVSKSNFLRLLRGKTTKLAPVYLYQNNAKACFDGISDAYYDI